MRSRNELLHQNTGEGFKGSIHMALFALASVCAAYNLGAVVLRPERRLVMNTLTYAGLAILEAKQVRHHWGADA